MDSMRIVNVYGGLGNQMFNYAFAISLKERFPDEEVLIDVSHFNYIFIKRWKTANLHGGYELGAAFPQMSLKKASPLQLMRVTRYVPNFFLSRLVRRWLPKRRGEYVDKVSQYFVYHEDVYESQFQYYEGLWGSIRYYKPIKEKLLAEFAHKYPTGKNAEYIVRMEKEESVGLHVRRGDYLLSNTLSGICDVSYYKRAVREILGDNKEHVFYIFSDDLVWCEQCIVPLLNGAQYEMVRENSGKMAHWDMFLMTHCKDLIIANSSFSWWSAFLNTRNGRIVTPKRWFNRNATFEIWDDNWIKV